MAVEMEKENLHHVLCTAVHLGVLHQGYQWRIQDGHLHIYNDTLPYVLCNMYVLCYFQQNYVSGRYIGSPIYPYKHRGLEWIPVLGSQPAGDWSHKPGSRLPLLSNKRIHGYLPSYRASLPFGWYQLHYSVTVCLNNLPKVAFESMVAGILLIASPPLCQQVNSPGLISYYYYHAALSTGDHIMEWCHLSICSV